MAENPFFYVHSSKRLKHLLFLSHLQYRQESDKSFQPQDRIIDYLKILITRSIVNLNKVRKSYRIITSLTSKQILDAFHLNFQEIQRKLQKDNPKF
ncbi:unnamed protein product [Paramecium sonneborni]|uniref:Uncharacterized protein n=1 Tax=Paramecium sonneborni TaxID=65129 RepID=A0A8S1PTC5_9CILI|nr:unnamed protein product [Paramecium sonneborni]